MFPPNTGILGADENCFTPRKTFPRQAKATHLSEMCFYAFFALFFQTLNSPPDGTKQTEAAKTLLGHYVNNGNQLSAWESKQ